jgi:hypothetical protein
MRLSVVVPAGRNPPTLGRCTAALEPQLRAGDELVVVDDLPSRSAGELRNAGAVRATGDVLVFVDADVVVRPGALEQVRGTLSADGGLVAVFGSYDSDPGGGAVSRFRNLLHHHVHQQGDGPARTFWAGLGAVRRSVFLREGGFDVDRYPRPMLEDVEFGLRLTDAGHRIELRSTLQGTHLKRWSLGAMVLSDIRDRGVPWMMLLLERRSVPAVLNLGWRHRLSAALVLAAIAGALVGPVPALCALAAFVALNLSFYRLLAHRGGVSLALLGPLLHVVHYASALVAVPAGVGAHLAARARARRRPAGLRRPALAGASDARPERSAASSGARG